MTTDPPATCTDCTAPISTRAQRGLCRRCRDRRHVAGTLPGKRPPKKNEPRACVRCGLNTTTPHRVCKDCRSVTSDLGEFDTWAAA